jgi:streptogramin lyase
MSKEVIFLVLRIRNLVVSVACLLTACQSLLLAHDPHDPFNVVAVSPNFAQDQTVLAATGPLSIKVGAQVVLRSVDGGVTWSVIAGLQNNKSVLAIAFSPAYAQDQTIFVAGAGGLFRTNNQGSSWTALTRQPVQALALSANFALDNTLFVVSNQNVIQKSTDRGQTLASVSTPAPLTAGLNAIAVSPNFAADNTLLVGGSADGIFRSNNGGSTWLLVSSGLSLPAVTALAFSPNFSVDQKTFAATSGAGVLTSTNAGTAWAFVNAGLSDLNVSDLTFSPNYAVDSTLWVSSATGGVSQSSNGGHSWGAGTTVSRALSPLTTTHYQTIAAGAGLQGNVLFLGMYEGLWVSNNSGGTWQYIDSWPTRIIRYINPSPGYARDQTVFVSTYGGGNLWSANGGTTWTFQNNGMHGSYTDASAISPNFPADGTAWSGTYFGLQRTVDHASTWQLMAGPPQGQAYPRALAISPNYANDATVFMGTASAGGPSGNCITPGMRPEAGTVPSGVWISTDGGNTWALTGLTGVGISSIALSPGFASDHTAFAAAYAAGLYVTTDGGKTWPALTLPGSPAGVAKVAVSPNFATDRIALAGGTNGGFFQSSNAGTSWTEISGTNFVRAMDIEFSPNFVNDQTVFISTVQSGLMKSTDGGRTFNTIATFPDSFVTAVGISPNFSIDQTMYAAGYHGLFKSVDGGTTWSYTAEPARIEESRNVSDLLQDPPTITYQGVWAFNSPSLTASTNAYAITGESQDTATLFFTGSGLRWISWTGPNQGSAAIQLDGISEGNVSLSGSSDQFQSVWEQHGLPCGNHTFTITGLPQGAQTVALDAFDIWVDTCPASMGSNPATLSETSEIVGGAAGTGTVLLLTNGTWTASSNASWLHIAAGSAAGVGSALIVYTYDANSSPNVQTGTLTIAGLTFIVTQAGSTYVPVSPVSPLVSSGLNNPQGLAVDGAGNVYIADAGNNAIKEWSLTTQNLTTLPSSGLSSPSAVSVDTQGNVYIADTGNNAIKKLTIGTGQVSTVASNVSGPSGIGVDASGNVYFSDTGNNAIREWNASISQVTTLATGLARPAGLAADGAGNVYFADSGNGAVKEIAATSHQLTTLASQLGAPAGVALDGYGNVYFADTGNNAVKQWNAGTQQVTTLSPGINAPVGVAVDPLGNVYVTSQNSNSVTKFTRAFLVLGANSRAEGSLAGTDSVSALVLPAGTPLTASSDQSWLTLTSITNGSISFAFTANTTASARIAHIGVLGQQITVTQSSDAPVTLIKSAGDGQYASPGQMFATPLQVKVTDANGIPVQGAAVTFTVSPGATGATGTFSATPLMPILTDQNGTASAPALTANSITGQYSVGASVNNLGVTFLVTNTGYALGTSSLIVGSVAGSAAVMLSTLGPWTATSNASWLHVSAGNATGVGNALIQFTYDPNTGSNSQAGTLIIGGLTLTVTQAGATYLPIGLALAPVSIGVSSPLGVAVDTQGNLYIADTANNAVEEWIAGTQQFVTLTSSGLNAPSAVAVDSLGNVYIADSGNAAIKEWSPLTRQVTTLPIAGLGRPAGLAIDSLGNLYIADAGNNVVQQWNPLTQQLVPLVASGLNSPSAIAVDIQGNVYIADAGNNAIKCWKAGTGQVSVLASAGLLGPKGVAVDGQGNVYIADSGNNALKQWSPVNQQVTGAPGSGLNGPAGLAVDVTGNLYVADTYNNAIREFGMAYLLLSATMRNEGSAAGTDSLGIQVLPPATPLTVTSDQQWLTVTGVTGGTINFAFTFNGQPASRTADLFVLGQQITIIQSAAGLSLMKTDGDGQSTPAGAPFGTALQITVLDASGFPTPGVQVMFTTLAGPNGANATFSQQPSMPVLTDGNGNAVAPALTANATAGSFTVAAGVQGFNVPSVTFTLTNLGIGLGASSMTAGSAAGRGSVQLIAAAPWTAVSNAAWLHVDPASAAGTAGSALVQFSYDANSNAAAQTGTLTIAGLTFSVNQAGTSYNPVALMTPLVTSGLNAPSAVAVDAVGNVFIADTNDNAIKEWSPLTKQLVVVTGPINPGGVSVDSAGNVYFSDTGSNAVKKWNASTQVTPLVSAGLNNPTGLAVDAQGNLSFADSGNNAIKQWNPISLQANTLVSTGAINPLAVAVDAQDNVYFADTGDNAIKMWSAAGRQTTTLVSGLSNPAGVASDGHQNVYFSDSGNNAIRMWSASTGQVNTLPASGLNNPTGLALDGQGNLYVADKNNNAIKELTMAYLALGSVNVEPPGAGSDTIAVQVLPVGTALAASSDQPWLTIAGVSGGFINFSFLANTSVAARVANITILGQQATVSQSGNPPGGLTKSGGDAQSTALGQAFPVALQVTVTDASGVPVQGAAVTFNVVPGASGSSGTFAAIPGMPVLSDQNGRATAPVLTANAIGGSFTVTASVNALTVTFGLTNLAYALESPSAVVGSTAGSGGVWLLAAGPWTMTSNASWLQAGASSGSGNTLLPYSYTANAGTASRTGTLTVSGLTFTVTQAGTGYTPVNLVQTLVSSGLKNPQGIALDAQGNVYIADTSDNAIKKWTASSKVVGTLVSTGLNAPAGVAVDAQGNLYIADSKNNAIKMWNASSNVVTTLVSTGLSLPIGMAVDNQGNVYFSDAGHNSIKEWLAATKAVITLVTGLNGPRGVAVDPQGNVYFADMNNNAIKEWIAVTKAVVTLVSSGLNLPRGVALDAQNNVYIADTNNNAIKEWSPVSLQVATLPISGLKAPAGVAVDNTANVYIGDVNDSLIKEFTAGYLSLSANTRNEGPQTGTDSVTALTLPSTLPLTATSNQSWLKITGTTGGAIAFSLTANTSVTSRAAQITVLGQTVAVTQAGDVPASVTIVAGSGQSTPVGHTYPTALQVRVKDAGGNGVSGAAVTFTVSPGTNGAKGTFASSSPVITTSGGYATASTLTANSIAGSFTVTATTGRLSATFHLTITAH